MATNLALDPKLIDRALKVSGEKTKKAAVPRALQEFIARRSQKRLIELMGSLQWDDSYDYKAERSRRRVCSSIRASRRSPCGATRPAALQRFTRCARRWKVVTPSLRRA